MGQPRAALRESGPVLRVIEGGTTDVTLLELVEAVTEITEDETEIVATVLHMLESGSVRLCGNFRGVDPARMR